MMVSISPKYSVAQVVGFIKGTSAINSARTYMNRRKNFIGENYWARGSDVFTAGKDEVVVGDTYNSRQRKTTGLTSQRCLNKPPSGGSCF